MLCSQCHKGKSKVLESRKADDSIRRRRKCLNCGFRYSTLETVVLQKNEAYRRPLVKIQRRSYSKAPPDSRANQLKSRRTDSYVVQEDELSPEEIVDNFLKGKL